MKLRVYLDTSVFSAYYDDRMTDRQAETEAFWRRKDEFEVYTSELTKEELRQTPDQKRRGRFQVLLKDVKVIAVTEEMRQLAQGYVEAGIFTQLMFNDALHVAVAVLSRQAVLLSWNFRHLVNRRRRAMVNELNMARMLPTIEMVAPAEV